MTIARAAAATAAASTKAAANRPEARSGAQYRTVEQTSLDESQADVVHLYAADARDKAEGTSEAPTFRDAISQHELIDEIVRSSDNFFR